MSLSIWRITKRKWLKEAFSGEGSLQRGSRWSSPGMAIVYAAQSQALAVLEMLVHLDEVELLGAYVLIPVEVDSSLITAVAPDALPRNWKDFPPPLSLRTIGDDWATAGKSAVLKVPSAVVPDESNFLINPIHRDFPKLGIGDPQPFHVDARLKRN